MVVLATDDGLSGPDAGQTLTATAERNLSAAAHVRPVTPVVRARRRGRTADTPQDHALCGSRFAESGTPAL